MVIPIRKQMDDLDNKIGDMEKSITLIAKHVKKELEETKKAQPRTDIKEIADLKKQSEKIAALESSMQAVTKQIKEELEATKREIKESQLRQLLEIKKMQPESGGHTVGSEKMKDFEGKIDDEISRLETFIADSNKVISQDIERKINQELSRLEDMIHDSGRLLTEKGMEQYIEKINKLKANLERYVNVKAQLLETRISELTESIKNIDESLDVVGIESKITALEGRVGSELAEIKKQVSSLVGDKGIQKLKSSLDDIEFFEKDLNYVKDLIASGKFVTQDGMEDYIKRTNKLKASMESYVNMKMQLLEARLNNLAGNIRMLESKEPEVSGTSVEIRSSHDVEQLRNEIAVIKNSIRQMAERTQASIPSMEGQEHQTEEELKQFKTDIERKLYAEDTAIYETKEKLEDEMKKLMLDFTYKANQMKRSISDDVEKFRSTVNTPDVQELKNELEELRQAVDNENANRLSLEKNFEDIRQTFANFNAIEEMEAIKQSVEEETTNRMSLEKSMADMERLVSGMKEKYGAVSKLEQLDFDKVEQEIAAFRESLKNAERETHLKVMNVVTEQLNEFARTMDRKIPEIITRDEFLASMREIKTKLRTVESPDLTPLALRVGQLERELANISNMMHSVYNRMPIVVE